MDLHLLRAQKIAQSLHQGIVYGATNMYEHVAAVAQAVQNFAYTENRKDMVIAAYLYKGITGMSFIQNTFGKRVANLVAELSGVSGTSLEFGHVPNWERVRTLSPEAQQIILAEQMVTLKTIRQHPNLVRNGNVIHNHLVSMTQQTPANDMLYNFALTFGNQALKNFREPQKIGQQNGVFPQKGQRVNE